MRNYCLEILPWLIESFGYIWTMKVDFMIVGAQKCATTSLFQLLDQHPSLYGSTTKEPHFFSTSKNWEAELDSYHLLYKNRKEGDLCFEASTTYTFAPHRNQDIPGDLFAYNPALKFIYLVRKPLSRIVSGYMHAYERGYTSTGIERALKEEPYFIDITRYNDQIAPYIERFGKEQVLVLDFDDFNSKRSEVIAQITAFLGVAAMSDTDLETKKANVSIGGNKPNIRFDKKKIWHSASCCFGVHLNL